MACVVFFRAVNVGGLQKFQPSALACELTEFGAVNVGAAGTLVVHKPVSQVKLRDEILRRLPFKPDLMICPAHDVLALVRSKPFGNAPARKGLQQFVSVMEKSPRNPPRLPLDQPVGDHWEVRVLAIAGRFVLSLRRPQGRAMVYPNAVVEKQFGVSATTRNWNTFGIICEVLEN